MFEIIVLKEGAIQFKISHQTEEQKNRIVPLLETLQEPVTIEIRHQESFALVEELET